MSDTTAHRGVVIQPDGRWSVYYPHNTLEDVLQGSVLMSYRFTNTQNETFEFWYEDSGVHRHNTNVDMERILQRGWCGPCVVLLVDGDMLRSWDEFTDLKEYLTPRFCFEDDFEKERQTMRRNNEFIKQLGINVFNFDT